MDSEYDEVGSNATLRPIDNYPSINEMIAAGKSAAEKSKRNSHGSFMAWFDRSEYLSIARTHYMMLPADHPDHMTPADYAKFRIALGIDITTGKWLPRLHQYRDKATAHYEVLADQSAERARLSGTADGFQWPGAKTTLAKMEELWSRNETAAADAKATKQAKAEAKETARKASEAAAEDNARKAAKYEAALTALADAIAKPDATMAVVKDILWEAGFADTVSTPPSAESATSDDPEPQGSNATEPPATDTNLADSASKGRTSRSKKAVKEVVQQAPAPVGGLTTPLIFIPHRKYRRKP